MEAVLLVIQLLLVLMPAINGVDFNSTVRLMQLGDWGGDENGSDGYATPAQVFMDSLTQQFLIRLARSHSLTHSLLTAQSDSNS